MSLFDSIQSLVVRGEQLFPFTCFDESIDWSCVLEWLDTQTWDGEL